MQGFQPGAIHPAENTVQLWFAVELETGVRPDKSLTPFEIRLYKHYRVVHGCRIALAFVLTFVLVRLLDIPEGTWPLITLVVVMGPISFWGTWSRALSNA